MRWELIIRVSRSGCVAVFRILSVNLVKQTGAFQFKVKLRPDCLKIAINIIRIGIEHPPCLFLHNSQRHIFVDFKPLSMQSTASRSVNVRRALPSIRYQLNMDKPFHPFHIRNVLSLL